MTRRTIAILAATLLTAGSAAAQTADTASAAPRNTSFSFGLGSSQRVGLWHRVTPRVQVGMEVLGRRETTSTDGGELEARSTQLGIAPGVKFYSSTTAPVLPYVFVGGEASFGHARAENEAVGGEIIEAEQTFRTLGAELGLGVDWFPVQRVSIGGHAAIGANWSRTQYETDGAEHPEQKTSSIGTFSSGVRVHFYF
jgi:hypothetical protein